MYSEIVDECISILRTIGRILPGWRPRIRGAGGVLSLVVHFGFVLLILFGPTALFSTPVQPIQPLSTTTRSGSCR